MWMPKRMSPCVTPVLSPALGEPAPGAPGVGAGAGAGAPGDAAFDPDPDGEAEPAAVWAAGLEPEPAAALLVPAEALPPEALAPAAGVAEGRAPPLPPPAEAAADAPAAVVADVSGAAGADASVLPPPEGAGFGVLLPPGRRDAAPLESPPPQAVRVRTTAASSDTPRTYVFIVGPPSPDDEVVARSARELRCVGWNEVAPVERVPQAGKEIWSVKDLWDENRPVRKRAKRGRPQPSFPTARLET